MRINVGPGDFENARKLLLEIGGNSLESWYQMDKPFEHAPELADALAKLVGYPEWDEDANKYVYR